MIKLINFDYEKEGRVFYISKDTIGAMNRGKNVTWIYTKGEEPAMYKVKETPEEILAMPDIETKAIDWEQRRYETAKEMLGYIYRLSWDADIDDMSPSTIAEEAAKYADALINELKKGQDNEN